MTGGFTHEPPGGGIPDWYTPPSLFTTLGLDFDLDPCAPAWPAAAWIPATRRYSLPVDGLSQPWEGRVWLNPPYAGETARWVGRLAEHGDGISLTFTRTDTPWWQAAVDRATLVCFIAGRVEFVPGDPTFRRRSRSGRGGARRAGLRAGRGAIGIDDHAGVTEQLNLFGLPATGAPPRTTHMTPAQREIVHGARTYGHVPAPAYYSSDGWDALKRLRERGLVHQAAGRGGPYHAGGG